MHPSPQNWVCSYRALYKLWNVEPKHLLLLFLTHIPGREKAKGYISLRETHAWNCKSQLRLMFNQKPDILL